MKVEKEAYFYELSTDGQLQCRLCPHLCRIADNQSGRCGVRRRHGQQLMAENYGQIAALAIDPVEKKPLYHFLPGSQTLSFATMGCNFSCQFCQNHSISQAPAATMRFASPLSPAQIVEKTCQQDIPSISFTYSEPTIFYEMMLDTAILAREAGLKTILVSNGFINPKPLARLIPYLNAANIDLKSFSDPFYQKLCGGRLQPVLNTLRQLKEADIWLEITTLLIPDHNDDPLELDELMAFICSLDTATPWHVSRFYPQYRMNDKPATPSETIIRTLLRAREKGLKHIYAGNLPGAEWQETRCSHCQDMLIERQGYHITREQLSPDGRCQSCQTPLAGRF